MEIHLTHVNEGMPETTTVDAAQSIEDQLFETSHNEPRDQKKRKVDLVVISDVHLGTYGCHATELLKYLKSIKPGKLILNGDIIDMWQFSKRFWPASHMDVVKHITELVSQDVPVYYITGNHDEMLRKFNGFRLGSFSILNKLVLEFNGEKSWVFHGDVFDITMKHSKWLARLGGKGYDMLIILNRVINFLSHKLGRGRISLSKKIKDNVKSAVSFISNFEETATSIAIENNYDNVICGHIHQPVIRMANNEMGSVKYLNSGDWVENLTSLEFHNGVWKLYHYWEDQLAQNVQLKVTSETENRIFEEMMKEFIPEMSR